MHYLVRIHRHGERYRAIVIDLPGCLIIGNTAEQVRRVVPSAIAAHVRKLRRSGIDVPTGTTNDPDPDEKDELCFSVEVRHRVYQIAKDLDKNPKEILEICWTIGIDAKNQLSSVTDEECQAITAAVESQE